MASLIVLLRQALNAFRGVAAGPPRRRDPLAILTGMDRYWNLHKSVAIACFFLSAALAVLAFFLINDLVLWMGVSKQVAAAFVALSWVLIFPIWALAFLLVMTVLYAVGIRDLRAIATTSLSSLALSRAQLRDLQDGLASRTWRHGRLFKRVVADLATERMRFGH